jgi:hypothetical protein
VKKFTVETPENGRLELPVIPDGQQHHILIICDKGQVTTYVDGKPLCIICGKEVKPKDRSKLNPSIHKKCQPYPIKR